MPVLQRRYHIVSPETLEAWAKNGDMQAWSVLSAREHVRRMATKEQHGIARSRTVFLSPTVSLLFQQGLSGPRWVTMSIIVSTNLTTKDFVGKNKDVWEGITQWRQFLSEWQGPWIAGGDGLFFKRLEVIVRQTSLKGKDNNAGAARKLNQSAVDQLKQYLEDCKQFDKASQSFKTELDSFLWEASQCAKRKENEASSPKCRGGSSYQLRKGLRQAEDLLMSMGLKKKDAQLWCQEAIESLRKGTKSIWKKKGPITGEMVRSRIRQFRKKNMLSLDSQ